MMQICRIRISIVRSSHGQTLKIWLCEPITKPFSRSDTAAIVKTIASQCFLKKHFCNIEPNDRYTSIVFKASLAVYGTWFAQQESDVQSEHIYFKSRVLEGNQPGKFLFLSECGGFPRRVEGHVTQERKNYGYGGQARSEKELTDRIRRMYEDMVFPSIPNGLCGCIYTQLSDVEGETNGLYTYDRVVRKVAVDAMLEIAERVAERLRDCL